jgi:hypothetical protein
MYLFPLLLSALLFIYGVNSLDSWLRNPERQIKQSKKERRKLRKNPFFYFQLLLMSSIYDNHPQFEIWLNRAGGVLVIAFSVIGFIFSIIGLLHSR